jgi:hypothetical protein
LVLKLRRLLLPLLLLRANISLEALRARGLPE